MALIRFNRLAKAQQFEYIPRYWDPEKEKMAKRLKRVEEIEAGGVEGVQARLRDGGLRRGFDDGRYRSYRRQKVMRSNMVLLGTIVVLLLIGWYLLVNHFPAWAEMMESSGPALSPPSE